MWDIESTSEVLVVEDEIMVVVHTIHGHTFRAKSHFNFEVCGILMTHLKLSDDKSIELKFEDVKEWEYPRYDVYKLRKEEEHKQRLAELEEVGLIIDYTHEVVDACGDECDGMFG